jgi:ATP-dependent protease ClpP protease subunit
MATPDPNYRPDPARSIDIFGEFNDDLVATVLPKIAHLRAQNSKPITVYINSRGGIVRCLEVILGAITSENLDGETCSMITVASGDASSAAASLFALGGYAIAYPHSAFHFHGIRFSEVEVTMEDASSLASHLSSVNRENAFRLARAMISRLVHRYSLMVQQFKAHRASKGEHLSEVECFVGCVQYFVSDSAVEILRRTLSHISRLEELSSKIAKNVSFPAEDSGLKHDATVLRAVLDYEVESHATKEWRLNEQGFAQVASDYFLLRDYNLGEHEHLLGHVVQTYGYFFLDKRDTKRMLAIRKAAKPGAVERFLVRKTIAIVRVFWYFTVVLCRQLQQGENRLEASDAYWLGIADEVVGLDLTGARAIMEEEIIGKGA